MIISNIFKIFKYLSRSIYITIELICFTVVIIMTSLIRWITLIGKWGKELVNSIVTGVYYLIVINIIMAVLYISSIIIYLTIGMIIGTIPLAESIASLLATIFFTGIYMLEMILKTNYRYIFCDNQPHINFLTDLSKNGISLRVATM